MYFAETYVFQVVLVFEWNKCICRDDYCAPGFYLTLPMLSSIQLVDAAEFCVITDPSRRGFPKLTAVVGSQFLKPSLAVSRLPRFMECVVSTTPCHAIILLIRSLFRSSC